MMKKKKNEKYQPLGTKISPEMADVLNAVCDSLQVDVYHLLQWFAYTVIRAASPMHNLDPRIQKLMTMLESDAGWQEAFNLANPEHLKVSQIIMILEQDKHKGFGAVMIDRPFMGKAQQTECVDTILERVAEVTQHGIYRRLRLLGAEMDCHNLSDVLLTLIDAQTIRNLDDDIHSSGPQLAHRSNSGKEIAFGKKTKAKQKRTPDSVAHDRRIKFTEEDANIFDDSTY